MKPTKLLIAIWNEAGLNWDAAVRTIARKKEVKIEENVKDFYDHFVKEGEEVMTFLDEDYPEELKRMEKPPLVMVVNNRKNFCRKIVAGNAAYAVGNDTEKREMAEWDALINPEVLGWTTGNPKLDELVVASMAKRLLLLPSCASGGTYRGTQITSLVQNAQTHGHTIYASLVAEDELKSLNNTLIMKGIARPYFYKSPGGGRSVTRYDIKIGFNTKQLWVYDKEEGVYIDPPMAVHEEIEKKFGKGVMGRSGAAIEWLEELVRTDPAWLRDDEFWYDDDGSFEI